MERNYTAIMLSKRKVGETDRLYTFYTLENGKMQSIGRGTRKPRAKLSGHLETLNQTQLMVARSRGLGNIASAVTEVYFAHIKSDRDMLLLALGTLDEFDRLTELEERDEVLFGLLRSYLATVDDLAKSGEGERVEKARVITQGFLFQVLAHTGYRVEVNRCVVSGAALSTQGRYVFGPDLGGVADARLARSLGRSVDIGHNAIKLVRIFLSNRLEALQRLRVESRDLANVEHVSRAMLRWVSR